MAETKNQIGIVYDFVQGIWKSNPIFRLIIGMCPSLAVTNMAINGFAMGIATTFVLIASAIVISLFRKEIPEKARIPIFIVVIATFVTLADMYFAAFYPDIHKVLGIYVPLIVVNCIILGRMEAFASKYSLQRSIADSLGMGVGFTLGLIVLGGIREILGFGTVFGFGIMPAAFEPMVIMRLPTGAFFTLGFLIALMNLYQGWKNKGGVA